MKTVRLPMNNHRVKTYNETRDFTRRVPTFRSVKQERTDRRIVSGIIEAYDVEHDTEKVLRLFFHNAPLLSNPIYWETLRTVWVVGGSTDNADTFRPYFLSDRGARSWFMTVDDAKTLDAMVFPKTLWRAYADDDDRGISWTGDKAWCEEYARAKGRRVKERVFERDDIYAYISRCGEEEYLVL